MTARLEQVLAWYRSTATEAVRAGRATFGDSHTASSALRKSAVVRDALEMLRRRNPNRPLLAEAVALRLARA